MNKTGKALLDTLNGYATDHSPVWLMRQAGRYLPEYRALRAQAGSFLSLCLNPTYAAAITLQPLQRFPLDAAILFADILLVPMALGVTLQFREGEGPVLQQTTTQTDIDKLIYDKEKVSAVFETLRLVKKSLSDKTTLIGFCGAPWTVACYMISGKNHDNFSAAKNWISQQPELLDNLIQKLIDASELYLSSQIDAGAECLQIFDSWAGLLPQQHFNRYVIEPTKNLVARIKNKYPHIPIIGFPREAGDNYALYIRETGIDALSIDQSVSLDTAKRDLQSIKPLQGNLDPALLVKGGDDMKRALEKIMTAFGPRHIVNLGHGVVPETPPENVAALVDFVHNFRT